ncbi:MAG: hypothetical protein K2F63_07010, partial [Muribaculaceae bacterium]|nr:hypothetical protein [Muribaculaceae bacterium]
MRAAIITRTLHSRGFGMTVGVLAFLAGCIYFFCGLSQPLTGDNGLALPSANEWIPGRIPDFVAGMAGSIAGAALMLLLNKIHNILRSMTSVYLAFFGVMMAATPSLLTQFYTGTLLMIAVGLSLLLILGCYR